MYMGMYRQTNGLKHACADGLIKHTYACTDTETDRLMETYMHMYSSALDKLLGQIGYLRNLVILNCVLAKTIAYFHIFFYATFFFL